MYLRSRGQAAEATEGLEQDALVDHGIQVSNKELSAHVQRLLLVGRGLIDTDRLSP
jgi:hypothetical protein